MAQFYDAVVIGGGPAGSTVATALARAGRSVIVFEKERFPRFHVGESLLPFPLPIFDRLGLSEKIRAAGFQEKYGAFFWNEASGGTRPVVFEKSWDDRHPMAYQVKRADFDELLLRHSEESGAIVREETAVAEVLFEEGRAVGGVAQGKTGSEEVRAKVVVDASGQTAFLSRKLGTRRFDSKLKRAAVFAHYEGVRRSCAPAREKPSNSVSNVSSRAARGWRSCSPAAGAPRRSSGSPTTRPPRQSSAATAMSSSATRRRFSTRSSPPASFSRWRRACAPRTRSTGRW